MMRKETQIKKDAQAMTPAEIADVAKGSNDGLLIGELIRQVTGASATMEARVAALTDIARHFSDSNFIVVGVLSALWVCDARSARDLARAVLRKPFDREIDLIHARAAAVIIEYSPCDPRDIPLIAKVMAHQNTTVQEPAKRALASLPHNAKQHILTEARRAPQTPQIQTLIRHLEQRSTFAPLTFPKIPREALFDTSATPPSAPPAEGPIPPVPSAPERRTKPTQTPIRLTTEESKDREKRPVRRTAPPSRKGAKPIQREGDRQPKAPSDPQEQRQIQAARTLNTPPAPPEISPPHQPLSPTQQRILIDARTPEFESLSTRELDRACQTESVAPRLLAIFCEIAIREARTGIERHLGRYVWLASHPEVSSAPALVVMSELFRQ
jgi:hypothetical protein